MAERQEQSWSLTHILLTSSVVMRPCFFSVDRCPCSNNSATWTSGLGQQVFDSFHPPAWFCRRKLAAHNQLLILYLSLALIKKVGRLICSAEAEQLCVDILTICKRRHGNDSEHWIENEASDFVHLSAVSSTTTVKLDAGRSRMGGWQSSSSPSQLWKCGLL